MQIGLRWRREMTKPAYIWTKLDFSMCLCEGCATTHPSRRHGKTRIAVALEVKERCEMCGTQLREEPNR